MKPVITLSIEAVVVGVCLVILTIAINKLGISDNYLITTFVSGALFHLIFEISGLNLKYSLDYCKIFEKS